MDLDVGMERLALLGVDRGGTVHALHSFFSIPIGSYFTEGRLIAFSGKLPTERLPPVIDLPVASFMVWCAVCTVPREYHIVHMVYVEGIPPSNWQSMPCKRVGKNTESRELACQGLTPLAQNGTLFLLGLDTKFSEA